MFIGNFKYSIDSKGRISIPAKLRKYVNPESNDSFVLTRGTEKNIDIYPMDLWKVVVADKLAKLNTFDPKESRFVRMLLQEASEDKLDSQSRLMVPKSLIEYASIEKDVFILGAMNKIEVWNPEVYDDYIKASPYSYEDIAKEVMKL
ncbi:MAG: division/cell wall cluster transcriptional repressor MraZ [Melioribacteraceae bacterium]|nr:division/cell wall cluster transcriptional repressor MraZ [Melioribacteraceae bacterium]MCO6473149.1 division/cell wall cluster transcriptional repressor MraZ [Melioribacteraceae bacterium]MDD3557035.1 division/cell wall cluster transcriptional repressor MraZ [Melioribacteraceae bacterium]